MQLVKLGADLEAQNRDGNTPLLSAARYGRCRLSFAGCVHVLAGGQWFDKHCPPRFELRASSALTAPISGRASESRVERDMAVIRLDART